VHHRCENPLQVIAQWLLAVPRSRKAPASEAMAIVNRKRVARRDAEKRQMAWEKRSTQIKVRRSHRGRESR
jgi:hypothetical protein